MEFTVIRSGWLRGGNYETSLEDKWGRRCCLGFLGLACGLRVKGRIFVRSCLYNNGEPDDREAQNLNWPESILAFEEGRLRNTSLTRRIIEVNDDSSISDITREATLTSLFASGGITITFVDE